MNHSSQVKRPGCLNLANLNQMRIQMEEACLDLNVNCLSAASEGSAFTFKSMCLLDTTKNQEQSRPRSWLTLAVDQQRCVLYWPKHVHVLVVIMLNTYMPPHVTCQVYR